MSAEPVVRIVAGELADDALAALTSVLVALAEANRAEPPPLLRRADWRCRDPYHSPSSWRL